MGGLSRRNLMRLGAGAGAAMAGIGLAGATRLFAADATAKGHLGALGQTALYTLDYPGDESVFSINLQVFPDDPTLLKNAGFKVFGPQKDKVYAVGGAQPGLRPNVSANLISKDRGTYQLHVYNYDPQQELDYELSVVRRSAPDRQQPGEAGAPVALGAAGGTPATAASTEMIMVDTHFHATPVWYDRVESALLHMNEQGVRYGCM